MASTEVVRDREPSRKLSGLTKGVWEGGGGMGGEDPLQIDRA